MKPYIAMPQSLISRLSAATLLLMSMILAVPSAAMDYSAYRVINTAMIVQNTRKARIAKGMRLAPSDKIIVNAGSQLWVREKKLGSPVYRIKGPTAGSGASLASLISEVKASNTSDISRINRTITNGLAHHSAPKDAFDRAGTSIVVTNTHGNHTVLATMLGPDEMDPEYYTPHMVKVVRRRDDGGLYHFLFSSEKGIGGLYVNAIAKDSDPGNPELMFPETIAVPAEGQREIADCLFVEPQPGDPGVIIIVSNEPFGIDEVKRELRTDTQDVNRVFVYYILR